VMECQAEGDRLENEQTSAVSCAVDEGAAVAAAEQRQRVSRRARGRSRRFAVENGCTRLWTFTYAPDENGRRPTWAERARVKRDWHEFARRLPPGTAWLRTLEKHADGHVHVHAAMSYGKGDERRTRRLARLWGHGFVDEGEAHQSRPGRNERARATARYVVKYATKSIEAAELDPGEHAYEVAQGFQPVTVRIFAASRARAWAELVRCQGGEVPAYEWDSGDSEDWTGPPVGFLSW
jgi:hypothetical protein